MRTITALRGASEANTRAVPVSGQQQDFDGFVQFLRLLERLREVLQRELVRNDAVHLDPLAAEEVDGHGVCIGADVSTQDVQLFQASVRDNITFFNRSIPDSKILEVIDALGLNEWLQGLPKGLDTKLETGGRSISAGEAQLLAFTRVFLRDPGLVILDEASSRLDPVTEQLIERAIDNLLRNRTAIVIAHRLGTLHRTAEIMIMENGRIVEYGDRLRLAADPNTRFHSLLRTGLEEVLA